MTNYEENISVVVPALVIGIASTVALGTGLSHFDFWNPVKQVSHQQIKDCSLQLDESPQAIQFGSIPEQCNDLRWQFKPAGNGRDVIQPSASEFKLNNTTLPEDQKDDKRRRVLVISIILGGCATAGIYQLGTKTNNKPAPEAD